MKIKCKKTGRVYSLKLTAKERERAIRRLEIYLECVPLASFTQDKDVKNGSTNK